MPQLRQSDVADDIVRHFQDRTTDMAEADLRVPIANFVSDEHAARERELMRRLPLVVAHHSELPTAGSFITRNVLGTSIIVVRRADNGIAAFLNMCRHRGGRVEDEASGSKRVFTCRYHGWSYDHDDGGLRNVPFREYFESVDDACSGLVPVQVEERHGMIWATLRGDGPSVEEFLGEEASRQLAAFELDRAVMFLDEAFTLDVNWKLVADGAIDVLHPKFLHPQGVGKLIETGRSVWRQYGRHGQSFNPRKKLGALVEAGEPLDDVWKYVASNLVVYPNCSVIAAPDHVEFWTVWPSTTTASSATVSIRFFIREEILDEAMAERLQRSWAILRQAALEEDFPMEVSIQANAIANPEGTFLYGRSEAACQHLHVWLERDLAAMGAG